MMIGMSFLGFAVMLVAGIIAALVLHFAIRYRFLHGGDGFVAKWIAGWIGAWLGAQVLGHWWFMIAGYYAIPALIGAFMGAFSITAAAKSRAQAYSGRSAPFTHMESGKVA